MTPVSLLLYQVISKKPHPFLEYLIDSLNALEHLHACTASHQGKRPQFFRVIIDNKIMKWGYGIEI